MRGYALNKTRQDEEIMIYPNKVNKDNFNHACYKIEAPILLVTYLTNWMTNLYN